MKKRICIFIGSIAIAVSAGAQGPGSSGSYYQDADGKTGAELKTALCAIIYNRTERTYGDLWTDFCTTDVRDDGKVWDMYSGISNFTFGTDQDPGSGNKEGQYYNREHSWPNSWFGGKVQPMYTDLHHMYPTDKVVNNRRSNYPFGETAGEDYMSANGFSKLGACTYPGYKGKVFEPNDEYKGDFARVYFYMVTIYQDYNWVTTWMVNNNDWKTLNQWSIDLLLKWAREDPVSEKEINRNDAVFRCQNNRNPFIDDPLLCEYIWGNRSGQDYTLDHSGTVNPDPEPVDEPTIITPTQGTILDFGEVKMGESTSRTLYVKGTSLTSNLTLQLYRYDYRMFSIPTTSIDYTQVCTESGYPLVVTYSPTALGEHKAKLLLTGGGMVGSIGIDIKARCVEQPADELITGDLNGDNKVDVSDVNIIINIILKTEPNNGLLNEAEPDINGDGVIDVADVNALINIVLNHE